MFNITFYQRVSNLFDIIFDLYIKLTLIIAYISILYCISTNVSIKILLSLVIIFIILIAINYVFRYLAVKDYSKYECCTCGEIIYSKQHYLNSNYCSGCGRKIIKI